MTPHSVYGSDVDQLYATYARNIVRHYAMREPTYRDRIPRPADRAFCRTVNEKRSVFFVTNMPNSSGFIGMSLLEIIIIKYNNYLSIEKFLIFEILR